MVTRNTRINQFNSRDVFAAILLKKFSVLVVPPSQKQRKSPDERINEMKMGIRK